MILIVDNAVVVDYMKKQASIINESSFFSVWALWKCTLSWLHNKSYKLRHIKKS